ncbi:glycosyltransferase family 4 protein [Halovivax limisalsi]|uniref:glycosyltransferase family 4 protein n=1 Tax=Halovivax limisalsi TaxID=1453760 RepID=UPI001FFDCC83|nr:glycosyltransferase family 4 protein [Halovivax limisalsi]
MARIAVAHTDLAAKGGGEGVCMTVLEALQDGHEVHLLTLTTPDLEELNRYFNTDVDPLPVRRAPVVDRALDLVDVPLYNLRNALLNRHVARHRDEYDLVVSTDNELSPEPPAVQYVHTPRFGRLVVSKRVGEDGFVDHLYDRLSYRAGGYDAERIRRGRLLTNSRWMANVVQDVYGVRPRVVYPPVDTSGFDPLPWDEREDGFVTVGRLARYKNVDETIRIVDEVRERGHDVHQHVVGPSYDPDYRRELEAMAADRDHVTIEGELPRADLVELLCTHRYGLHGKRHEHFGMAVAELVAAGAVAFVPDNGGQRDVVDRRDALCYRTPGEAVEQIDDVLSNPDRRREVRLDPARVEARFGRKRFREEMRSIVREALRDDEIDADRSARSDRRARRRHDRTEA